MWDVRDSREHFVSSKVLSWVALDRGIRLAHQRGLPADEEVWIDQRDAIHEEVMSKGWNAEKESFVRHYGSEALDASLLLYVRPASAAAFDEKIKAASRKRFGASRRSQIGPRD